MPCIIKSEQIERSFKDQRESSRSKTEYVFSKTNDGKQILREMMERYLPKEVVSAEKQGFSSPDASWFKGESIDFVKREIFDPNAPIYSFLDYKSVTELVSQHLDGKENRRLFIWSLLNVNKYLDQITAQ